MIVPSRKLLWLAALGAIPLITLIGIGGSLAAIGGTGLLFLVMIAVIDAASSRSELNDLIVLLPGRLNLFKGRAAEIEVRFANPRASSREVRIGLNLPPSLKTQREDMRVQLAPAPQHALIRWPCTPRDRGHRRRQQPQRTQRLDRVAPRKAQSFQGARGRDRGSFRQSTRVESRSSHRVEPSAFS